MNGNAPLGVAHFHLSFFFSSLFGSWVFVGEDASEKTSLPLSSFQSEK
jgi:hypothetical protein